MTTLTYLETRTKENRKLDVYQIADYKVLILYIDNNMINFTIRAEHDDFTPNIYYCDGTVFGEQDKPHFEIQTSSYGALNPSQIEEVIKGYQTALRVVEVLTDTFIK